MIKKLLISVFTVAMLAVTGCKTPIDVDKHLSYAKFETECLGVAGDGTQTLRVWGEGKNRQEAIDQAKRNAVRDVIFKGITAGSGECNKRPLVTEVNAHEKYEDYFNAFFSQGGAYNKYVTLDEKRTSRIRAKGSTLEAYGVVVKVDRAALRQRLNDDNVID